MPDQKNSVHAKWTSESCQLHPAEEQRLWNLKARIAAGLDAFLEVGAALLTICDRRLYRAKYSTFDEYCRKRWKFTRSYAYRLLSAAVLQNQMSPIGDIPKPTTESQLRPLAGLRPEDARHVWQEAVKMAKGAPVTAKTVELAKDISVVDRQQDPTSIPNHLHSILNREIRRLDHLLRRNDLSELVVTMERMKLLIERYGGSAPGESVD